MTSDAALEGQIQIKKTSGNSNYHALLELCGNYVGIESQVFAPDFLFFQYEIPGERSAS